MKTPTPTELAEVAKQAADICRHVASFLAGASGMTDRAIMRRMRTCATDILDLLGAADVTVDDRDPADNPHPQMRDLAARLSRSQALDIRAAVIDGQHVLMMPEDLGLEPWASMTDDQVAAAIRDGGEADFTALPWGLRAAGIETGVLQDHRTWSEYGLGLAFPKKRRRRAKR